VKIGDYRVDCCNENCSWSGLASQCLRWKHDTGDMFCPECHEVVEPVDTGDERCDCPDEVPHAS
jgi:hypothetical protein